MENSGAYSIMIEGHISSKRAEWFEDIEMVPMDNGNTLLRGNISDQAKLYSVLNKIMDLGLKLISVEKQNEIRTPK